MPSLTAASYQVLLELTNDTTDPATIEIHREGILCSLGPVILLRPREGLSLILEAGSTYKYAVKHLSGRIASLNVRSWRDLNLDLTQVFPSPPSPRPTAPPSPNQPVEGVIVNYLHRDPRSCPPPPP